jgi:hypothetical protein
MSRDLKTEPSAKDNPESYLQLALPREWLPGFSAFASAALPSGEELNPAFGGGLGFKKSGYDMRLEGLYTRKELSPRQASTWFSSAPPLPKRDFHIYALGAFLNSPVAGFAADWAYSETFAWGSGAYANASIRLGNKPWRFSLAGDGVRGRFADRSGAATHEGFRVAAKGERFRPRSGLLRLQTTLRSSDTLDSSGPGSFDRGNLSLYFRPSAPTAAAKRNNPFRIRFSRASLSLSRDARNPEKTADSLDAGAAFSFGPLSTVFSGSLDSKTNLEGPSIFQPALFENFEAFKVSGELGWKPPVLLMGKSKQRAAFDFKTRLGYTLRAEKDNIWELSFNSSLKTGKWGRVGLRIASTDFPEKWNYTLSWRFERR